MTHGSARTLERAMRVSTMRSAPPESASSLPKMAPRAISTPTPPMVEPKPVVKLRMACTALMPATRPVTSAPIMSETKG